MLIDQQFDLFSKNQLISNVVHSEVVKVIPTLKTEQLIRFEVPASQRSFTRSNFKLRLKWSVKNGY